jgi:hypothetical protein
VVDGAEASGGRTRTGEFARPGVEELPTTPCCSSRLGRASTRVGDGAGTVVTPGGATCTVAEFALSWLRSIPASPRPFRTVGSLTPFCDGRTTVDSVALGEPMRTGLRSKVSRLALRVDKLGRCTTRVRPSRSSRSLRGAPTAWSRMLTVRTSVRVCSRTRSGEMPLLMTVLLFPLTKLLMTVELL